MVTRLVEARANLLDRVLLLGWVRFMPFLLQVTGSTKDMAGLTARELAWFSTGRHLSLQTR